MADEPPFTRRSTRPPDPTDPPAGRLVPVRTTRRGPDTATRMGAAAAAARAAGEDDVDDPDTDEEIIDDSQLDAQGSEKLYFRIGEVAQIVGVDAHVLRYWETEFKMKPHRSSSGQRLYRKQDLSRFLRIKALLHDEGYTIAGARRVMAGGQTGPSTVGVDPSRVRDALHRIEGLRAKIRALRDEVEFPPR